MDKKFYNDSPISNFESGDSKKKNMVIKLKEFIDSYSGSSFSIGINGAWGSGKSSFINMLEDKIKEDSGDEIITIRINPIIFENIYDLFYYYIDLLIEELENKRIKISVNKKELRTQLYSLARVLLGSMHLNTYFGRMNLQLPEKDPGRVEDTEHEKVRFKKNTIDKILVDNNLKVVILIDEIDRMDMDDIYKLFKFINLVANFYNHIYILGLEENYIRKSLSKMYGSNNILDKFIQFSIEMTNDPVSISHLFKEKLYEQDDINNINDVDKNRLDKSIDIASNFLFIRNINRILNVVKFKILLLKDQVNIADFVIMEIVKEINNKIYYFIIEKKIDFTLSGDMNYKVYDNKTLLVNSKEKRKELLSGMKELKNSDEEYKSLLKILSTVFYHTSINVNEPYYDFHMLGNESDYTKEKRFSSSIYFNRYINKGIKMDDFDENKLSILFNENNKNEIEIYMSDKYVKNLLFRFNTLDLDNNGKINFLNYIVDFTNKNEEFIYILSDFLYENYINNLIIKNELEYKKISDKNLMDQVNVYKTLNLSDRLDLIDYLYDKLKYNGNSKELLFILSKKMFDSEDNLFEYVLGDIPYNIIYSAFYVMSISDLYDEYDINRCLKELYNNRFYGIYKNDRSYIEDFIRFAFNRENNTSDLGSDLIIDKIISIYDIKNYVNEDESIFIDNLIEELITNGKWTEEN